MRIGRAVIIPTILALGVAGSSIAGASVAVASSHLTHQVASGNGQSTNPDLFYHA